MKKILFMAAAILFACTANLFAQEELSWDGDGTASSPYEVSSAEHFRAINTKGLNKYYKQTADIVFENVISADYTNAFIVSNFKGNYDGNGKSITFNMEVNIYNETTGTGTTNPKVFAGLFDTLSGKGVIKNLKITNSSIKLYNGGSQDVVPGKLDWHAGLLCGRMEGVNTRIANCMITDSWIDAHTLAAKMAYHSFMHVGGVVGYMISGTLHEVAFINTNTDTDPNTTTPEYALDGLACVGGIVAKIDGSAVQVIESCLFRGSLRVQKSESTGYGVATVGGIVGRVHSVNASSRISNCYVDASEVISTNSATGQAAAAGISVSAVPFDIYHCYADVEKISVDDNTGTWYPITGKTQGETTEKTNCEYSGATVKVGGIEQYYSVGYKASSPTNDQTTAQKPDALWYLGDDFIQLDNGQIALKSTIKGYIYSDRDGDFNNPATWQNYPDSWRGENLALDANHCDWSTVLGIEIKHKVTLSDNSLERIGTQGTNVHIKIIDNNGRAALIVNNSNLNFDNLTIKVEEGGSFVNTTANNAKGVIEKRLHGGIWNFIGLSGYTNLAPLRNRLLRENQSENAENTGSEILKFWALGYDYANSEWNEDTYLYWEDNIAPGAGILVYTNGDNILVEIGQNRDDQGGSTGLNDFENAEQVSLTFQNCGPWVALSNPYPAVMDARKAMEGIGIQNIQGQGLYVREAKSYDWTFITNDNANNKQINAAQGFFVQFVDSQNTGGSKDTQNRTITLSKDMLVDYPATEENTSKIAASGAGEFLRVSVASEGYRVPVMYRQNDAASAEYDIFDADKLFGSGTVAEPYFALGERMLCKQEADSTHFVTDLNIRSEQSRSVEIIAEYIPEGYTLSLIDDNNETVMNQDDVYTADIARGDNEGRFKLVINKNNVSIEDVANVEEIKFYNNNRQITISGGNIKLVQVYNTLGQKVYETKQRTFTLDEVASGTYIVNVQTDETSFSNKIVVH